MANTKFGFDLVCIKEAQALHFKLSEQVERGFQFDVKCGKQELLDFHIFPLSLGIREV